MNVGVIPGKVSSPEFKRQTKTRLGNPQVMATPRADVLVMIV